MLLKKIIVIVLALMLIYCTVGCSTIDIMKSLNSDDEDTNEFVVIDDSMSVDVGLEQDVIETDYNINDETKMRESIAYFEDNNGFIVPIKTKIPWEEGIAKAVLKNIIKGNYLDTQLNKIGLHGVIPEGTKILGMSINEGLCKIDFSEEFQNIETFEEEKNMISAITYTLTEFSTIDKVKIMVEGEFLSSLPNGYSIDTAFERENINLFGREEGANYIVYYKNNDTETASLYVPITFTADVVDNPINIVLQRLFNGPPADLPMTNEIPYGVNLNGIKIEDSKVHIDLNMGALNLTQEEYDNMSQIIVLCLEQFDNIAEVDFFIEGMTFEEAGMELEDNDVIPTFNEY